ncbi:ParB/Srx family N-terminal domain-containing protein [Hyphomicrobium sp.]|uniref:ParB/Srx family N-terminal domain-containing protein n=1 Tax=Hyphomicrobium sp. TaxID=82 RepID=UPI002FE3BBBE
MPSRQHPIPPGAIAHSAAWSERVPLGDLRPTQVAVGMRAVEAKRRKIERCAGSARKLRRYVEKRPVPAVLGPDEEFYIIDHHHLSLALWQSAVDEVLVRIVGDMSDLPSHTFLKTMATFGWLHPYDADGRRICPTHLPATLDRLRPDLYRDLAWSVRKAGGFLKTAIPFGEFAWANFFRTHIPQRLIADDFERAHDRAMHLAHARAARHLPGSLAAA